MATEEGDRTAVLGSGRVEVRARQRDVSQARVIQLTAYAQLVGQLGETLGRAHVWERR